MSHCFIFYWISNKNFSQIGKKGKTLCKKCDIFLVVTTVSMLTYLLFFTLFYNLSCSNEMVNLQSWGNVYIGFWDSNVHCRFDIWPVFFFPWHFDLMNCTNICFILTELTEISWYEWFIIAIRRLRSTIMLMIEKLPNITNPQNLVNSLIPANSKLSRSIKPNDAQNRVWVVSHRLKKNVSD